jgi:hypothetical protein
MGLWEFLRQWRPSRVTVGIVASILLHLAIVALVLWGGKLVPSSRWNVKKGDSLIVELPKPEEPAPAGLPSAPAAPPSRPSPPAASPKPPAPAPPAPRSAPAPPEERRVASAPRAPAPTPPAPKAAEPAPSLPRGTEPAPAPAEPASKAEPTPRAAEPTPPQTGSAAPPRPPAEQQVASLPPGGQPAAPPAPDMRTALRRGAGGTGLQARGGIEGEAIPLDSEDPNFNDYLDQVRRRIKEKWGYPCIVKEGATRNCEYKTASLDVQFGILKDGRIQFVEVNSRTRSTTSTVTAIAGVAVPPVPGRDEGMRPGSTGIPSAPVSWRRRVVAQQPAPLTHETAELRGVGHLTLRSTGV